VIVRVLHINVGRVCWWKPSKYRRYCYAH